MPLFETLVAIDIAAPTRDAERAFAFIAAQGWDARMGGLWWDTAHPYKAGEPLPAGSALPTG